MSQKKPVYFFEDLERFIEWRNSAEWCDQLPQNEHDAGYLYKDGAEINVTKEDGDGVFLVVIGNTCCEHDNLPSAEWQLWCDWSRDQWPRENSR